MDKRTLLWDMSIAEKAEGVRVNMHRPVRKNIVLKCDAPWEGEHCGYGQVMYDGEKYRLYYRGSGANAGPWNMEDGSHHVLCVAYSKDGKTFEKPDLDIYEYKGSKHNNIVFMLGEKAYFDNFAIFIDKNPNCPEDEKYKSVSMFLTDKEKDTYALKVYKSADGLHWQESGLILDGVGAFDSMNIAFWDERLGKYCLYFRGYHDLDPQYKIEHEKETHVRDIRVTYSDDFVNWSEPKFLDYKEDKTEFQLYTNGMIKYHRADIYLGLPTRYIDRSLDSINYKYLPDLHGYREIMGKISRRSSIAMNDTLVMYSKDGVSFTRSREAFVTPGPENGENWVYGDCYFAHGMVQTGSDFYGEPDEISIYAGTGYRSRPVTFERHTLRLDGFFSLRADYEDGEVITKPIVIEGDKLSVNFATSAIGYLKIELLDEKGNALDGYVSQRLFGDSTDRPVDFEKPLSELSGKTVRMKITMKDADFYSFCFEK